MQLTEGVKPSFEDRKELERKIKDLITEIEESNNAWYPKMAPEMPGKIKELRRLRRMRYLVEDE